MVFQYIVEKVLSKKERKDFSKVFRLLDKDGDGSLTPLEIRQGLDKHFNISMSSQEIDDIMRVIDINQNGLIEFSEFLLLAQSGDKAINKKLAFVFNAFDKDEDGFITTDELIEGLGLQSDSKARELIRTSARETDDRISFTEFWDMMKH